MKVDSIYISNFRTIKKLEFYLESGINVFVGPNGSGKSNILFALNRLLKASILESAHIRIEDFWFSTHEDIMLHASLSHNNDTFSVSTVFSRDKDGRVEQSRVDLLDTELVGYYKYFPSTRSYNSSTASITNGRRLDSVFDEDRYRAEGMITEYMHYALYSPEKTKELSDIASNIVPGLEKIYISFDRKGQSAELLAVVNNFALPFHKLSSGMKQLLGMILPLVFSKDSLILIDEPELHMNPRMIIAMSNLIKNSSSKNNNQFVIATHSPAFLSMPGLNIIPVDFGQQKKHEQKYFTTFIQPETSDEFVDNSFLKGGK